MTTIVFLGFLIWANLNDLKSLSTLSLKSDLSPKERKSNKQAISRISQSTVLKIFVNYVQIISIIKSLNLSWPSELIDFFTFHSSFGQITDNLLSVDCIMSPNISIPLLYMRTIAVSILPYLIALLIGIFWLGYYLIKRVDALTYFISSLVIFFFLVQPTIINFVSRLTSCREIDEGKYYVYFQMTHECYTEEHTRYVWIKLILNYIALLTERD